MNVGAGTVINGRQCVQALNAGAKFIVSPGLSVEVAEICKANDVPYYPGCVTPTEIMQALDLGITTVKFIPTGGINRENLDEFLAFDKVAAVGGSFFVEEALNK